MTDFDTAARQEAERRYPAPEADADRLTYPREALRDGKRRAFEAGARWGASPLNVATLRATFARAERAEAVLREVAALADESRRTGKRLSALEVSDILARTQQTGADR